MSENLSGSDCPYSADLVNLLDGDLERELCDEILTHIGSCNQCQQRLEELIGDAGFELATKEEVAQAKEFRHFPVQSNLEQIDPAYYEIPDVLLGELIGGGGMGYVFVAEQQQPVVRKVAVKFIRKELVSQELIDRFARECSAMAGVEHPGVARMYDAGQLERRDPYLVMEFVDGPPLTEFCKTNQLPLRDRLEIFVQICDAIQFVHTRDIIHRDLKPDNILVASGQQGPVPKLIDFGLAKFITPASEDKIDQTRYGQTIGTLRYMSPEQAGVDSDNEPITNSADIYSLGVLLYELISGDTPLSSSRFKEMKYVDQLLHIRNGNISRLSHRINAETTDEHLNSMKTSRQVLVGAVVDDLDWVVAKALERKPSDRYGSVNALAQEVKNYLEDWPVSVGKPKLGYVVKKFCKRNRLLVGSTLLVFGVLAMGIVGTSFGLVKATRAIKREVEAREEVDRRYKQEQLALTESESRRVKIQRAAKIVKTVFDDLPANIASIEEGSELRSQLVQRVTQAVDQMLEADVAEDPDVLMLKVSLVQSLVSLGEPEMAASLMLDLLKESEGGNAFEFKQQLVLMTSLGDAYRKAGKPDLAIGVFQRAIDSSVGELPPGDPIALSIRYHLATAQADAGNHKLALATINAMIQHIDTSNAKTDSLYSHALTQSATLNLKMEDLDSSIESLTKILHYWEQRAPAHHPMVLESRKNLADILDRKGKHALAAKQLEKVLAQVVLKYAAVPGSVGRIKIRLASSLAKVGETPKARRLLNEVAADTQRLDSSLRARFELILLRKSEGVPAIELVDPLRQLIVEMQKALGGNDKLIETAKATLRKW